jgi:hypothetical protein
MTHGAGDFSRLLRLFRVLDQSPIVQGIGPRSNGITGNGPLSFIFQSDLIPVGGGNR